MRLLEENEARNLRLGERGEARGGGGASPLRSPAPRLCESTVKKETDSWTDLFRV